MEVTSYTLCQIRIEGLDPFFCNGIKITEETEVEGEYDGGSRNVRSWTFKKGKVDFEILEPKDHMSLNLISRKCTQEGLTFTIIAFAQDNNANWVAMERLDGCIIPGRERTIGQHDSPKLGIKGHAASTEPLNAAYS